MTACRCAERHQPLPGTLLPGSNDRRRQWVVLIRNESRSAFNGHRPRWSAMSLIACRVCGAQWRTKSRIVDSLPGCPEWPERHPDRADPIG